MALSSCAVIADAPPFLERKANSEFEVQLYIDNLDAGGLCHAFHCGVGREDLGCSPSSRMAPSCIEAQDVSRISQQAGPGRSSADTISQEALGEERFVKCWVGFLRGDLGAHLQPLQVMTGCDINFGSYKELFLIPAAESHIAAANQHFAFFSAEEGEDNQAEEEADQEQNIKLHQKAEMLARPSRESHAHRETWEILTSGVHRLLDHAKKEKAPTQHACPALPPPAVSGKTASHTWIRELRKRLYKLALLITANGEAGKSKPSCEKGRRSAQRHCARSFFGGRKAGEGAKR